MTVAEFEALVLRDVAPPDVQRVVNALHNRKAIYARRNRSDVRIFSKRPAEIAGIFEGPAEVDRLISSAAPHMRRLACALTAREVAKASGDTVSANAARDALDVSATRLVSLVRKHAAGGVLLSEARESMWATFHNEGMVYLAVFEPALARDATCELPPKVIRKPRIKNGLGPREKVAALIEKAGVGGIYKTDLCQSIQPKLPADKLAALLNGLVADGRIDARQVRVRGSQFATRFFGVELAA